MATKNSMEDKLLSKLNEHQRSLVKEYYKLQNSPSLSTDDAEERICSIWEEAQADEVLCKRLEFIDALFSSISEKSSEKDSDSRAYWAEYLVPKIQTKLDQEEGRIPKMALEEGYTWLIECPDGQNFSTITLPNNEPQTIQQFADQMCGRCESPYSTHRSKPVITLTTHK